MSLLDGKYEVLRQKQVDPTRTVFEATAPDGTLLRIEWFDLAPEQESGFERYRRAVKRLKRTGRTAIYDVTSRPGARYVAWERPPEAAGRGRDPELEALLDAEGFERDDALLLRDQGHTRLFGLAFGDDRRPFRPDAADAPHSDARTATWVVAWWERVPDSTRAWALAFVLLAVGLALAAVGFDKRTSDRIVTVPDLAGRPVNAAAAELHASGFGVELAPSSSDAPAGTVLSVEPPPGTSLRPGRTIRLEYALPSGQLPPTEVPRLVGETFPGGVTERLRDAGLVLGHVSRIEADVPRDAVIAQSVAPGDALGRGEAVDILVSDGPRQEATFLPDLIGLDIEDARVLAGLAGIPADRIVVDSIPSQGPPGRVLGQSLAPHRVVPREDAILRLIVGAGGGAAALPDAMPSLVGMDEEAAIAAVGTAQVEIAAVEIQNLPEGVIDQEPDPGAPRADRVLLTVNVHPVAIPVPAARAEVRAPRRRTVPFAWSIEPGIPEVTATVYASTLDGETFLVHSERAAGGEIVEGTWTTSYPGVVTFRLELNGQPYSTPLRVP